MKSPFPGMDSYLERHWGDVHQRIVTYARDWLQSRLPGDLRARMQERVYIEIPDVRRGEYVADVRVIGRPQSGCPLSRFRSGRRTRRSSSIYRRLSTSVTAMGATTISTIAVSRTRHWRPTMRRGPTPNCMNRAGVKRRIDALLTGRGRLTPGSP